MKRYLCRYVHHIDGLPDFSALRFTKLNQYESLIMPLVKYLESHGVRIEYGMDVKNVIIETVGDKKIAKQILYVNFLLSEKTGDQDTRDILDLKALIRRGEATAACRHMGLPTDHIHFLNLPFYETGTIKKGNLSQKDADIVKALLQELKPQEIFVAGDLADPHGTHKVWRC